MSNQFGYGQRRVSVGWTGAFTVVPKEWKSIDLRDGLMFSYGIVSKMRILSWAIHLSGNKSPFYLMPWLKIIVPWKLEEGVDTFLSMIAYIESLYLCRSRWTKREKKHIIMSVHLKNDIGGKKKTLYRQCLVIIGFIAEEDHWEGIFGLTVFTSEQFLLQGGNATSSSR